MARKRVIGSSVMATSARHQYRISSETQDEGGGGIVSIGGIISRAVRAGRASAITIRRTLRAHADRLRTPTMDGTAGREQQWVVYWLGERTFAGLPVVAVAQKTPQRPHAPTPRCLAHVACRQVAPCSSHPRTDSGSSDVTSPFRIPIPICADGPWLPGRAFARRRISPVSSGHLRRCCSALPTTTTGGPGTLPVMPAPWTGPRLRYAFGYCCPTTSFLQRTWDVRPRYPVAHPPRCHPTTTHTPPPAHPQP